MDINETYIVDYRYSLNSAHEMFEVLHSCDVIIVSLKLYIWIDVSMKKKKCMIQKTVASSVLTKGTTMN